MKIAFLAFAASVSSLFDQSNAKYHADVGIVEIAAQKPWEAELQSRAALADGTKRCLFLHGVGEDTDSAATSTYEGYWGKVHEHTPQCGERVFWHRDTSNRAFNDPTLVNYYCEMLKSPSNR